VRVPTEANGGWYFDGRPRPAPLRPLCRSNTRGCDASLFGGWPLAKSSLAEAPPIKGFRRAANATLGEPLLQVLAIVANGATEFEIDRAGASAAKFVEGRDGVRDSSLRRGQSVYDRILECSSLHRCSSGREEYEVALDHTKLRGISS
jgi:hypothetical protein